MTEESQLEYWNNKFKEVKPLVLSVNYILLKDRIRDVKDRCTTRTVINQTRLLIGFGVWCEKPIKKLVKADMDKYFDTLEGQADVTISTTKQVIKSFLKTVNPKVAVTIKPKKIKNKLTPDSLLTDTDISKMIKAAPNLRDKAFLACLWDSGARKGELTSTTIADAKFDKYGCMLWLRKGKTGARPARLVFASSYLSDWLDAHPTKENKNSPIFCSLQEPYNLISDNGIYEQLKRLAKKAGVTKRVNCHNWRHTRATDLAKKITEQQMKAVLGWSAGSVQTQTYVHLSAQDVNDAMLEASGIEVDEEEQEPSLLSTDRCPRCGELNNIDRDLCHKCGLPLSEKKRLEIEDAERKAKEAERAEMMSQLRAEMQKELNKIATNADNQLWKFDKDGKATEIKEDKDYKQDK